MPTQPYGAAALIVPGSSVLCQLRSVQIQDGIEHPGILNDRPEDPARVHRPIPEPVTTRVHLNGVRRCVWLHQFCRACCLTVHNPCMQDRCRLHIRSHLMYNAWALAVRRSRGTLSSIPTTVHGMHAAPRILCIHNALHALLVFQDSADHHVGVIVTPHADQQSAPTPSIVWLLQGEVAA